MVRRTDGKEDEVKKTKKKEAEEVTIGLVCKSEKVSAASGISFFL